MAAEDPALEEYRTLRQELLQTQAFSRQLFYWSALLVVVGIGWYFQNEPRNLSADELGGSLLVILVVVYFSYVEQMDHIYRIGAYIAIFLESANSEAALMWNRFNRRAGLKDRLNAYRESPAILYSAGALGVVTMMQARGNQDNTYIRWIGCGVVLVFIWGLKRHLNKKRFNHEAAWLDLKQSPEDQKKIHILYGDSSAKTKGTDQAATLEYLEHTRDIVFNVLFSRALKS